MQVSDSRVFADAEKEVENQRLVKGTPARTGTREQCHLQACLGTFIQIPRGIFKYGVPKYTQP